MSKRSPSCPAVTQRVLRLREARLDAEARGDDLQEVSLSKPVTWLP